MPADYLSRYTIAALNEFIPQVDPLAPDLQALQAKDPSLQEKAICQAHGSLLSGHDALDKTYIRLTSSFFCPTVKTTTQNLITRELNDSLYYRCFHKKRRSNCHL